MIAIGLNLHSSFIILLINGMKKKKQNKLKFYYKWKNQNFDTGQKT